MSQRIKSRHRATPEQQRALGSPLRLEIIGQMQPQGVSVAEVAQRLHAHPHSVRRWADSGLLHCYRIGMRGDRRFRSHDVEDFLVTGRNGSHAG